MSRYATNFAAAVVAIVLAVSSLAAVTSVPAEPQFAAASVTVLA